MSDKTIDREQPLDVCKIQARAQLEHREKKGMSKAQARRIVSEESGIPVSTLKKWSYPKAMEADRIRKRKASAKKKTVPLKTGRSSDQVKTPDIIESTVDSIVLTDRKVLESIRSIAHDTGMPINTIILLGLESYKNTYL